MNILRRIYNKVKSTIGLTDATAFHTAFNTYFENLKGGKERSSWVWDCIDEWGKHFGKTEYCLYNRDNGKKIETHPILDIFAKPNPYQYWFELKYNIAAQWSLFGRSYFYKVRDGLGIVRQLYQLPPSMVTVINYQSPLDYFQVQTRGGSIRVEPNDMVYLRYPDPNNFFGAKAIIDNVATVADADALRNVYEKKFFEQGGFLGLVFTTDNNLTAPVFQNRKEELREAYRGTDNAYKIALFDNGIKPVSVQHTIKDMDIAPMKDASRDEILAAWKISKFQLGMGESINRATAVENQRRFAGEVIEPLLAYIDDILTSQLCMNERGWDYVQIKHEETSPKDLEGDLLWYEGMSKVGAITPNEIRDGEEMPLLVGPEYDKPLVLQGVNFAGTPQPAN